MLIQSPRSADAHWQLYDSCSILPSYYTLELNTTVFDTPPFALHANLPGSYNNTIGHTVSNNGFSESMA